MQEQKIKDYLYSLLSEEEKGALALSLKHNHKIPEAIFMGKPNNKSKNTMSYKANIKIEQSIIGY